jgi:hypothetical protein
MPKTKTNLHALNELRLVFANGAANVRSDEEGVKARKDPEHLVRVLRGSELKRKRDY